MVNLPVAGRWGERRKTESIGALVLTEVTYQPEVLIPRHTHERACLALTLKGQPVETFGPLQMERSAGTVLYRPAGEPHCDRIASHGAMCLLVEFRSLTKFVLDRRLTGREC